MFAVFETRIPGVRWVYGKRTRTYYTRETEWFETQREAVMAMAEIRRENPDRYRQHIYGRRPGARLALSVKTTVEAERLKASAKNKHNHMVVSI